MPKIKGPLRLYNMFPRSFKNFDAMREYVGEVARMGFNAVWLNPLQEVSQIQIERRPFARQQIPIRAFVGGSLYAMRDHLRLNKEFISYEAGDSDEVINQKGERQLKALIAEIKKHKMVALFDLVMNHVAKDSSLVTEHQEWFKESDVFHDVLEFKYGQFEDEIIEKIWRPYVSRYIAEYGFDGVRVDAAAMFSVKKCQGARKKIYQILSDLIDGPTIFEEWLFSGLDTKALVEDLLLDEKFVNYVTTSLFYNNTFDTESNGLSAKYKDEVRTKEKIIFVKQSQEAKSEAFGGVLNFPATHDTSSALYNAASNLVDFDKEMFADLKYMISTIEAFQDMLQKKYEELEKNPDLKKQQACKRSHDLLFILKSRLQFCMVKEALKSDHLTWILKKQIAISALTGGGGFVLTSGEESGDVAARAVFLPIEERDKRAFLNSSEKKFDEFLLNIAGFSEEYISFCTTKILAQNPSKTEVLAKDIIVYEAKNKESLQNLKKQIVADLKKMPILQSARDSVLVACDDEFVNFGRGGKNGKIDLSDFIANLNSILAMMPEGRFGHFSEVLHLPDKPELVIVARTNGADFKIEYGASPRSQCDLVIVNSGLENVVINDEDLHKIYIEFEKIVGMPYDGSYNHIASSNLHLSKGIINNSSKKEVSSSGLRPTAGAVVADSLSQNIVLS